MHHQIWLALKILLALIVGQFVHVWVLASISVNSSLNGITTYGEYLHKNLALIMMRFLGAWGFMEIYRLNDVFIWGAIRDHAPGMGWLPVHPIPVIPATALLYALFLADPVINLIFGLLSRAIPSLKVEVPPTLGTTIVKAAEKAA